ncbi:5-oxoprolinase subunit B family protein [Jannaschia sp. LMIT008]|uniref:5-oxoprolinase subunit B family protein n=1 Tax=Jannaschia maritima TaxID=3032585 RepID=UPI0028127172|nr:carboxyltransferase domain-containing protein [Jannaschia sp. LMIT008]
MTDFPRIEPLGEAAWLVRFADRLDDGANRACLAFRAGLLTDPPDNVAETASSLGSVLVRMDDPRGADAVLSALERRLADRDWQAVPLPPRRLWRIPCCYDGDAAPEIEEAAALAGLSVPDAVAALSTTRVRVLALGFVPGMPYLGTLPPEWDLPRRSDLTPRVPEGALVVAVRQLVLFGTSSPTGWRQVGLTAFGCFRQDRDPPIALRAGDEVVFPAIDAEHLTDLQGAADGLGGSVAEDLE